MPDSEDFSGFGMPGPYEALPPAAESPLDKLLGLPRWVLLVSGIAAVAFIVFAVMSLGPAGTAEEVSLFWNFGDGFTTPAVLPSHTYSAPGNYTLSLTITRALDSSTYSALVGFVGEECPETGECLDFHEVQDACRNDEDDDGDGLIDCEDPDCKCETLCTDNVDNDLDGLTDCRDFDCNCTLEDCDNQLDDDGDGFIDCNDPQCENTLFCCPECEDCEECTGECPEGEECRSTTEDNCKDNIDNDADGLIDCYDTDCSCTPEICVDAIDNDGDGKIDAADPECHIETACHDGKDNDNDGISDCGDYDCWLEEGCWLNRLGVEPVCVYDSDGICQPGETFPGCCDCCPENGIFIDPFRPCQCPWFKWNGAGNAVQLVETPDAYGRRRCTCPDGSLPVGFSGGYYNCYMLGFFPR